MDAPEGLKGTTGHRYRGRCGDSGAEGQRAEGERGVTCQSVRMDTTDGGDKEKIKKRKRGK